MNDLEPCSFELAQQRRNANEKLLLAGYVAPAETQNPTVDCSYRSYDSTADSNENVYISNNRDTYGWKNVPKEIKHNFEGLTTPIQYKLKYEGRYQVPAYSMYENSNVFYDTHLYTTVIERPVDTYFVGKFDGLTDTTIAREPHRYYFQHMIELWVDDYLVIQGNDHALVNDLNEIMSKKTPTAKVTLKLYLYTQQSPDKFDHITGQVIDIKHKTYDMDTHFMRVKDGRVYNCGYNKDKIVQPKKIEDKCTCL